MSRLPTDAGDAQKAYNLKLRNLPLLAPAWAPRTGLCGSVVLDTSLERRRRAIDATVQNRAAREHHMPVLVHTY